MCCSGATPRSHAASKFLGALLTWSTWAARMAWWSGLLLVQVRVLVLSSSEFASIYGYSLPQGPRCKDGMVALSILFRC